MDWCYVNRQPGWGFPMQYSILVIEAAGQTRQAVSALLPADPYTITSATTIKEAVAILEMLWPDLVICNLDGSQLTLAKCRSALQETGLNLPVLILTEASPALTNAETFLPAPFTANDLRHAAQMIVAQNRFLRLGNFTLDTKAKVLLYPLNKHRLTPKLYHLLHLLMVHEGKTVTRKAMMQQVWETDYMGDTRTLDVHIRWLREKIEADPSEPKHLHTVRGEGYRFVATTT